MESLHSNYNDTTDSDYNETLVISWNLLNDCGSRKGFIMTVSVLLFMSGFQKDCQTFIFVRLFKRVVSVKISSHDASFTSNQFKFHFLWKTYSLVSDDFCSLSAMRITCKDR